MSYALYAAAAVLLWTLSCEESSRKCGGRIDLLIRAFSISVSWRQDVFMMAALNRLMNRNRIRKFK